MRTLATVAACWLAALALADPASALDPARSLDQFHHAHFSMQDGAPTQVNALAQTPDGFLWIGTSAGLYQFDGVRAERFDVGQPPNPTIHSLATNARGDLWIGLNQAKLVRLRDGKLTALVAPAHRMGGDVLFLAPDGDDSVWVGLRDEVLHFDGRRWRAIDSPWPSATTFAQPGGVWGLALGRDGTVWAKNLLGLYYLRQGAVAFEQAPGYGGGLIDFARDREGGLWTADFTQPRFYRLPELQPTGPVPPPPRMGAPVPPSVLAAVWLDRDHTLWNANRVTGGLHRTTSILTPAPAERFAPPGRMVDLVTSVLEDREGAVWIGSRFGLDRFRPANIVGEPALRVRAQAAGIVATPQAVFAYSGMGARVSNPDDPGRRLYRIRPGQAPEVVAKDIGQLQAIAGSPDGELILASEGGLLRWRGGVITPIAMPRELLGGHVANLVATGGDTQFVSIFGRGAWRRSSGRWTRLSPPSAPPGDFARLAADATGAAWLFYHNGLIVRVAEDQTMEFPPSLGARIGTVRAFLPDSAGPIIVGSLAFARFDGQQLQVLPAPKGLALDYAPGITQTSDGSIWLLTAGGVVQMGRSSLLEAFANPALPLDFRTYDTGDGFQGAPPGDLFNRSMVAGPDGRVWMLMFDRVAWIDPRRLHRNHQPPPVVIRAVTANGRIHSRPHSLVLPPGTSQLQIDYTALSLAAPERVRFRYRLEGVDKDWIDSGGRRQAFYANLQPGNYRFRVIAANGDGVWNTSGASVAMRLKPTFWQSWAFKGLAAFAVAIVLWLLYRLRLRQVSGRIRARLAERMDERERIARELHDTLLQAVQGLSLKLQAFAEQMPAEQPARRLMEQALDRAEEVVAEGRARVRRLRTTQADRDLPEALTAAIERLRLDPDVESTVRVEGDRRPLHPVVLEELLGIVNEALFNAFTHARAEHVSADVHYGRGQLRLRIRDDGVGIAADILAHGRDGHFGLAGMRERAAKIRGDLTVRSHPGEGVEILLVVPAGHAYARPARRWRLFTTPSLEAEG